MNSEKIQKKEILAMRIWVVLFLVCFSDFAGFPSLVTKLYQVAIQYILVFIWMIAFFCFGIINPKIRKQFLLLFRNRQLIFLVLAISFLFAIEFVNSVVLGNRSFVDDILKQSFYFAAIFLIFPLSFLISFFRKFDSIFLKKTVLIFSICLCGLGIFQSFVLMLNGPLFLVVTYTIRGGIPRVLLPCDLNFIVLYYSYFLILSKKESHKLLPIFAFLLISICDIFVVQTRGIVLTNLCVLFVYTIWKFWVNKRFSIPAFIYFVSIILFVFMLIFDLLVINEYEFFSSLAYQDGSIRIRIETIRYFFSRFLRYPFLGQGFVKDSTSNGADFFVYHGYTGTFCRIDVGFTGFLDEFGILAFLLYFIVIRFFANANSFSRNDGTSLPDFNIVFSLQVVFSLLSLCVFDYQRFLGLVLCLALCFSSSSGKNYSFSSREIIV